MDDQSLQHLVGGMLVRQHVPDNPACRQAGWLEPDSGLCTEARWQSPQVFNIAAVPRAASGCSRQTLSAPPLPASARHTAPISVSGRSPVSGEPRGRPGAAASRHE